jgi:hypothetical protein
MAGYYDVVLGLIPLTLAGISGVLSFAGMALSVAIPIAGVVSIALIGHAMFVRTPTAPAQTARTDSGGFNAAD